MLGRSLSLCYATNVCIEVATNGDPSTIRLTAPVGSRVFTPYTVSVMAVTVPGEAESNSSGLIWRGPSLRSFLNTEKSKSHQDAVVFAESD